MVHFTVSKTVFINFKKSYVCIYIYIKIFKLNLKRNTFKEDHEQAKSREI